MKPSKQIRELAEALVEDRKRQAVDAAKKRAVAQQVDYETFKNMVSVAHLKHLQAPSAPAAGGLLPAWVFDPTGVFLATKATRAASTDSTTAVAAGVNQNTAVQQHTPQNSQEFIREWRRKGLDSLAKFRLLQDCGPAAVALMFKVEVTGELLGQLLLVLQAEWRQQRLGRSCCARSAVTPADCCGQLAFTTPECSTVTTDAQHIAAAVAATAAAADDTEQKDVATHKEAIFVVELLHQLTGAGRFELNARLIGSKAKQAATQLCSDIEATLKQHQSRDDHAMTGSHTGAESEQVASGTSIGRESYADGVRCVESAAESNNAVQQSCADGRKLLQQQMQGMQSADITCETQQQVSNQPAAQALARLAFIRQKLSIAA